MKLHPICIFLAAFCLVTPGAAIAQAQAQEVALHIAAEEEITADSARVTFTIVQTRSSKTEASTALRAEAERLTVALADIGVSRQDVEFSTEPGVTNLALSVGFAGNEMSCEVQEADETADAAEAPLVGGCEPSVASTGSLIVLVRDLANLDRVKALSSGQSNRGLNRSFIAEFPGQGVQMLASDPDAARRAAIVRALAKARSEADAYAAALGYRINRITGVGNGRREMSYADLFGGMFQSDSQFGRMFAPATPGKVRIEVDYVLVPN